MPPYDGGNTIRFYTAWSSVPNVIRTLSGMFPETELEYRYADEDLGYNIGHMHFLGGHCIDVEYPLCQSAEAYEMAADIIGFNLEEHGWLLSEDGETYVFGEPDPSQDMGMNLQ